MRLYTVNRLLITFSLLTFAIPFEKTAAAMAKNVKINLSDLSNDDLNQRLQDEQVRVKQHSFNHVITPLENPMQIRAARREVARLLTEVNKRKAAQTK